MKRRWHLLAHKIKTRRYRMGAEVGVGDGKTSKYLLEHCPVLFRHYAVDVWEPTQGHPESYNHKENLDKCRQIAEKDYRLKLLRKASTVAAQEFNNKHLDYVFIDADHDYESVLSDINVWLPKIRPGGLICGHDYNVWTKPGVVKAVNEVFEHSRVVEGDDITWWVDLDREM